MVATKSDKIEHLEDRLSSNQINALGMMLKGCTDLEIATALGVTRPTVTRWRNKDPHFRAYFNELKRNRLIANQDGLMDLLSESILVLKQQIIDGNWQVALSVLKLVKAWEVSDLHLPTDPKIVGIEIAKEEARTELEVQETFMDPQMAKILHIDNLRKLLPGKIKEVVDEYDV